MIFIVHNIHINIHHFMIYRRNKWLLNYIFVRKSAEKMNFKLLIYGLISKRVPTQTIDAIKFSASFICNIKK